MSDFSRRNFLKSAMMATGFAAVAGNRLVAQNSAAGDTTASASSASPGHVSGSQTLRVGVIGAGGRGTGAAKDCVHSSEGIEIVAIGDAFMDRAEECWNKLKEEIPQACKVTRETLFDGIDCYEKVLKADVDMVILATPPGFRPTHLRAAIDAGKHVFAEKPVAVDPVGIRHVIETAKMAKAKNLAIVAGTQRRHHKVYQDIMKRIQDGAIGEVVGGQCYWIQEGLWVRERQPGWSDMEWQMRNWLYFDWTSGDIIVEQHLHNIDIMNWVMGGPPEKCIASGGRLVRDEEKYGNVYDHFDVEFEYANGVRIASMCRQWEGGSRRVGERIVGTKGTSDPSTEIWGANAWKYEGDFDMKDAYVQEHADLVASIRKNEPLNELERVAESCMTAIMGRTAAYTGQMVSYKWMMNASKLDLTPEKMELGPHKINPVPKCGVTKLV
jgi:predicted dehydrogenase